MRSLFVDDILGAKPTHRYYDKIIYRHKLQNQIERFGPDGKDYKRQYKWYISNRKSIQPLDKIGFPIKLFNHQHNAHLNPEKLNDSFVKNKRISKQKVTEKVTAVSPCMSKSSILSNSGQNSLVKHASIKDDNPYFPHRYVQKKSGQINKWLGNKQWNQNYSKLILIPRQSQTSAKRFDK